MYLIFRIPCIFRILFEVSCTTLGLSMSTACVYAVGDVRTPSSARFLRQSPRLHAFDRQWERYFTPPGYTFAPSVVTGLPFCPLSSKSACEVRRPSSVLSERTVGEWSREAALTDGTLRRRSTTDDDWSAVERQTGDTRLETVKVDGCDRGRLSLDLPATVLVREVVIIIIII